jgi:hypothetical protein
MGGRRHAACLGAATRDVDVGPEPDDLFERRARRHDLLLRLRLDVGEPCLEPGRVAPLPAVELANAGILLAGGEREELGDRIVCRAEAAPRIRRRSRQEGALRSAEGASRERRRLAETRLAQPIDEGPRREERAVPDGLDGGGVGAAAEHARLELRERGGHLRVAGRARGAGLEVAAARQGRDRGGAGCDAGGGGPLTGRRRRGGAHHCRPTDGEQRGGQRKHPGDEHMLAVPGLRRSGQGKSPAPLTLRAGAA